MADAKPESTNATPAPPAPAKKGGGLKAAILLVAVLVLEGGTIGMTMMFAGGPRDVKGVTLDADKMADQKKLVEIQVVKDKFENIKTGRQYLYDTEVYCTVRKADEQKATDAIKDQKAQISMAIGNIIREADPSFFQEATLATLTRQIKAELDKDLGKDADGKPVVQEVLITRCIPFRGDF